MEYDLKHVQLNVLAIERTFVDKIMSVKRHAYNGSLANKVRHIYDVTKLYKQEDIKLFIDDRKKFKEIIQITKETDSFYFEKRKICESYNPVEKYDFEQWKDIFCDKSIQSRYESLHEDLLFTNEKQYFEDAINTFTAIDKAMGSVGE